MSSPVEDAINDAFLAGKALCKTISPNNVGLTGSHECGFYLPTPAWKLFSIHPPEKGSNHETAVQIRWQDEVETDSRIKWYGEKKHEYRLTRFGRGFEWLKHEYVGALLLLVPFSMTRFHAYVFDSDEEIELVTTALGVETLGGWGIFEKDEKVETEVECLDRVFSEKVKDIGAFPSGDWMAENAQAAFEECRDAARAISLDSLLLNWVRAEYRLFRTIERKLCLPEVRGPFEEIDDFIAKAATIMNRRKSRAGHSLENHVECLLKAQGIQFDSQPRIDGKIKPDLLIPGKFAYEDPGFLISKQMVVGIKTTCKDRWRQVLNEAKRIPEKHILTLQEAVSPDQLAEMREANVTLVVPKAFHSGYGEGHGNRLLSIEEFVAKVKEMAAA